MESIARDRLCGIALSSRLLDEAVVRPAGQYFFVDVGLAAARPSALAVMGLAAVAGNGAARKGTAAVTSKQNDALPGRGQPLRSP